MIKSIRWLLAESKVSSLNPDIVNFDASTNKLICYHLTSHQKWAQYNKRVRSQLDNPTRVGVNRTVSDDDSRAKRILKNLHNKNKTTIVTKNVIEEEIISDIMGDPYTDSSGFNPGGGDYHGKGLYTCYKFNPSIASTYGDICLVFEIDISRFLILSEDLAKLVHGKAWKVKDQLLKLFSLNSLGDTFNKNINAYNRMIADIKDDQIRMNKSVDDITISTAKTSRAILSKFGKNSINKLYDGVVLFGTQDGPVCASFIPQYDAKLIGLGRLDNKKPDIVDWYDSLNDFVGGTARNKLDFETMNNIAEENYNPQETEEEKSKIRGEIDLDFVDINQKIFFKQKAQSALLSLNNLSEDRKLEVLELLTPNILNDGIFFSRSQALIDKASSRAMYEIFDLIISNINIDNYRKRNITMFLIDNALNIPAPMFKDNVIAKALIGYSELFDDVKVSKNNLLQNYARTFTYIFKNGKISSSLEDEFKKIVSDYSWVNLIDQGDLGISIKIFSSSNEAIKQNIIKYCYASSHVFSNYIDSRVIIDDEFERNANEFLNKSLIFVGDKSNFTRSRSRFARVKLLNNFSCLSKNSKHKINFNSEIIKNLTNIFKDLYKDESLEEIVVSDGFGFINTFSDYIKVNVVSSEISEYFKNIYESIVSNAKEELNATLNKIINNSIEVRKYNKFLGAILDNTYIWDDYKSSKVIFDQMSKEEKTSLFEEIINSRVFQYTTKNVIVNFVKKILLFESNIAENLMKILIDQLESQELPVEIEMIISTEAISEELYKYGISKLLSIRLPLFAEDSLIKSIHVYKMMLVSDEVIEIISHLGSSKLVNMIIKQLSKSFVFDVDLKNSPHNPIQAKEKLKNIISNDNVEFYERFIEIIRDSINSHEYNFGISELKKMINKQNSGLDLSHRILIGRTLKEIYNIKN